MGSADAEPADAAGGGAGDGGAPVAGGATVHIRCTNGSKFTVQAAVDVTVGEFKGLLARNCDVPADQQRLIYKGRILKDDQTLDSYGRDYIKVAAEIYPEGQKRKWTSKIVLIEGHSSDRLRTCRGVNHEGKLS